MKSIKILLSGIGLLIFGIACFEITKMSNWTIFDYIGLIAFFIGTYYLFLGISDKRND